MSPDFNLCDVCGERVPQSERFFAATGREYNGIENETQGVNIDLCGKHLVAVIKSLIGHASARPDYDAGKRVVETVEALKRKR